jgi:hypothetical protein
LSEPEKASEAEVWLVGSAGPEAIALSGAVRSTVHSKLAGVGSTALTLLVARTSSLWLPSASPSNACGEVHARNAVPSSEHSNVASARSEEKVKIASVSLVGETGPGPSVVSGVLSSKTNTSSGAPSIPFSRLASDCSSPTPFSAASWIRKPLLADT